MYNTLYPMMSVYLCRNGGMGKYQNFSWACFLPSFEFDWRRYPSTAEEARGCQSRDSKRLADWLMVGYHCDVTHWAIFRLTRSLVNCGNSPSLWAVFSLNNDRYQPRWSDGRTNIHCPCVDRSVSSQNTANSWFRQTNRGWH